MKINAKIGRAILSVLLSLLIAFAYTPVVAFAEDDTVEEPQEQVQEEALEEVSESQDSSQETEDVTPRQVKSEAADSDEANDSDIDSGIYDNVSWRITSDYELIIGEDGETQTFAFDSNRLSESYPWYKYGTQIRSARFAGIVEGSGDMSDMFYSCSSLTNIDLSNYDTSNVTDISGMFDGCEALTSIDLSSFSTSNVTNISRMFYGCEALTSIDLSSFSTSSIDDMSYLFDGCSSLESLDLSSFDTSKVENMQGMFIYCSSLTSLDIRGLDTSNVKNMSHMFHDCSSLTSLDLSNLNTSSVTNMTYMFENCSSLTSLDISSFDTSKVSNMNRMFGDCTSLTSLDLSNLDTRSVTDMGIMFYQCSSLTSLDISSFDTHNVTNMEGMFSSCWRLTNLDLSSFDTSQVENAAHMFDNCKSLTSLDLSNFNLYSATNLQTMFFGCDALTKLRIGKNFNSRSVPRIRYAFFPMTMYDRIDGTKYEEGDSIPCSNVVKTYVTEYVPVEVISGMYDGVPWCIIDKHELVIGEAGETYTFDYKESRDNYPWHDYKDEITTVCFDGSVSGNGSCESMFAGFKSVKTIDFTGFYCSSVTSFKDIFSGCISLESLKTCRFFNDVTDSDYSAYFPVAMYDSKDGTQYEAGENIPDLDATRTYLAVNVPGGEIPEAKEYTGITGTINKTGELTFDFDETDFSKNSKVYHHKMGKAAIALSLMAYNESPDNLEDVLIRQMEFKDVHTWDENMQDNVGLYSPYMVAHKKVLLDGEETELVIVVIRGTYHKEWLDDFDSGTGTVHEGFERAKDFILEDVRDYLASPDTDFDETAKMKILVTGHSRGAAVSNLIGKDLDDGALNTDKLTVDDIFVFTFATPNTAVISDSDKYSYNNIFNIVNPEDFVTKVIPSAWGFGRYGTTYVLPSKSTETANKGSHIKYSDYLNDIKRISTQLNAHEPYQPYSTGALRLSLYVKSVTFDVPSVLMYYNEDLYTGSDGNEPSEWSLHDLYKYMLGGNQSKDSAYEKRSEEYIGKAISGHFGLTGLSTIEYFLANQKIKPEFECAHVAETYYAAMNSLSSYELMQPRQALLGVANCPVDVTVRDSDGNIVGQIINDEVVEAGVEDTGVVMMVDGESKIYSVPKDGDFTVEISGNDTGTMEYSLREEDADAGEIRRVYYHEVPVTNSTTLTQTIEGSPEVEDVELVRDDGLEIEPDAVFENNGVGKLFAEVTVEGNGVANSLHNLNPGDYITLLAIPEENAEFQGWYDEEGTLIATENEYSTSMVDSIKLIAKFKDHEHTWNDPTYTWADDNSSVTAKRICKKDPSHEESETAVTTSEVTKEPTYDAKGETTYTATFTNAAFEEQTKTVANIPKKEKPASLKVKSLWASEHSVGKVKFKWTKISGVTVTGWNLKYRTRKIGAGGKWSGWTTKSYPANTYEAWINIPTDYVIEIHAQAKGDKTWSTGIITCPAGGRYQAMKTVYVKNVDTNKRLTGTTITIKKGKSIKVRPDYEYPVADFVKRPRLYPNQMLYDVADKSIVTITKPDGKKYTGGMIDGVATITGAKVGSTEIIFRAPNGRTQKFTIKVTA